MHSIGICQVGAGSVQSRRCSGGADAKSGKGSVETTAGRPWQATQTKPPGQAWEAGPRGNSRLAAEVVAAHNRERNPKSSGSQAAERNLPGNLFSFSAVDPKCKSNDDRHEEKSANTSTWQHLLVIRRRGAEQGFGCCCSPRGRNRNRNQEQAGTGKRWCASTLTRRTTCHRCLHHRPIRPIHASQLLFC